MEFGTLGNGAAVPATGGVPLMGTSEATQLTLAAQVALELATNTLNAVAVVLVYVALIGVGG